MRKASAPAKQAATAATKPETKKPTLPPLATTLLTKTKDRDGTDSAQTQSPAIEVISARPETKGKKTANDSTAASTPVTPAASATIAKGAKNIDTTSKVSGSKSKEKEKNSNTATVVLVPEPVVEQAPILARQTKKSKPQQLPKKKPIVIREESMTTKESTPELPSNLPSAVEATTFSHSFSPSGIRHLLEQLHDQRDLRSYRFFNEKSLKFSSLDNYRPIVDALASISQAMTKPVDAAGADAAMIAFLQLHSALMDMILELRNMMPWGTWKDNHVFEAVLQDLKDTKGSGYATAGDGPDAISKKAHWMHGQCKCLLWRDTRFADFCLVANLEELHASINQTAMQYMLDEEDKSSKYKEEMDIKQLEAELAMVQKDVQSSFEELREAMTNNAKLVAELA